MGATVESFFFGFKVEFKDFLLGKKVPSLFGGLAGKPCQNFFQEVFEGAFLKKGFESPGSLRSEYRGGGSQEGLSGGQDLDLEAQLF